MCVYTRLLNVVTCNANASNAIQLMTQLQSDPPAVCDLKKNLIKSSSIL